MVVKPGFPIGVEGKEWVNFPDTAEKTLGRENVLDVEGLSCCPDDVGAPGIRRMALSPSGVVFFALKLHCGSNFFVDDFVLAEAGLGGNPALVEEGVGTGGTLILTEAGNVFSNFLSGICKDERLGRLE